MSDNIASNVVRYHDIKKTNERWAAMEGHNILVKTGAIPNIPPAELAAWAETAPSEYCAPSEDSA